MTTNMLQAALDYAAAGLEVFPLTPRGKTPACRNGLKDATTDTEQIRRWWTDNPDANIGGRPPEGMAVLDIDPRAGGTLDALGDLPDTQITATGGGGWHVWMWLPDGHTGKLRGKLDGANGIDIKGHTGYLVMPPSVHPGGGRYIADNTAPPTYMPAHLVERVTKPEPPARAAGTRRIPAVRGNSGHVYWEAAKTRELAAVAAAPVGTRNTTLNTAAFNLGQLIDAANVPAADVADELLAAALDTGLEAGEARGTIASGLGDGQATPRPIPARRRQATTDTASNTGEAVVGEPPALDDVHFSQYLCDTYLAGTFCWAAGLGWMRYTGTHWQRSNANAVTEQIRQAVADFHAREATAGADVDRLKRISGLLSGARIRTYTGLAHGILEVDTAGFDNQPDLLNVGNGVVNLRTGELIDHDPALMMTKHTTVDYRPGARHDDWDTALEALPAEVADWIQIRIGQAATGHPTSDDVLPVLVGGGANGKSTMLATIGSALGDYAVAVPERVLMANPSDHPTELMTLRGARLAVIEETPEARHISVKRLKDILGTDPMTARYIRQDTVQWSPTHSLVLATNYTPAVQETDHGTWRRLALVRFPYTYRAPGAELTAPTDRPGDPNLRQRLKTGRAGRAEAVLAWIVAGAMRWYAASQTIPAPPATVASDTADWRATVDHIAGFLADMLTIDPDAHVMATELHGAFTQWLADRQHRPWSDQTFASRFGAHDTITGAGITRKQTLTSAPGLSRPATLIAARVPARYQAWHGVKFRTPSDEFSTHSRP